MLELILGGARSGKSAYAQQRAIASNLPVCFIATAQAGDAEMQARIARHQAERPASWQTLEEPIRLSQVLQAIDQAQRCVVIDCLTLWMTNLLMLEDEAQLQAERQALLQILPTLKAHIILVSNEVGQGIVPMNALSRRFVDESGWLHQGLATMADSVVLMAAGLPLKLKGD